MKIIDVKVEVIHIPMKKPFRIAFAVQDHSVNVLVKVMTDVLYLLIHQQGFHKNRIVVQKKEYT